MLYKKIIAVCSEIRREHINTLRGQNVEFLFYLVAHEVTTGSLRVKTWKRLPKF